MKSKFELMTALRLLEAIGGSRALTVAILLRYEEYDSVVSLRTVPEDYSDADSFFQAYQATRLLQKSEWLPTTFDKKAVATESFMAAERSCRQTNELIRALREERACAISSVVRYIPIARRKISQMLRKVGLFDFLDHGGFGPGADMSTRGGWTSAYDKLSKPGSVTIECTQFLDFLVQSSALQCGNWSWDIHTRRLNVDRVPGNRITFVPKDCKTRRTIAVEPRWNIYFQKGVGRVLRNVLKRTGIDLDDQSRNQDLARHASIHDDLATVDLQSASDSISYELVRWLLPERWVTILSRLRSPSYLLNGEWHRAEKWSSMGNGYTFELESMLFYSLCWSVCGDENVSVYGDDLIIPSERYSEVVELLNFCGFTVNEKKSFATGPFRESCGADFFLGQRVTPIYWKDALNDEGTLRLVNQISRLAGRSSGGRFRDRRFERLWRDLVYRLPSHYRRKGPLSIATCVHSPSGEWAKRARWGWDGWEVTVVIPVAVKHKFHDYFPAVASQWFQPQSHGYVIRDKTRLTFKTVFIPCFGPKGTEFEDVGPWSRVTP
jgi:hypothetical protein